MAAMANAIGNKSLFFSKYESYKKVKTSEITCAGKILIQLSKKAKSKSADQKEYLKSSYENTANALWQYLNMLLALKTWKRYMEMYDSIEKDEVDIDSTDFVLEEIEEEKAKFEKAKQLRSRQKQENKKLKIKSRSRSKRSSLASRNSSAKGVGKSMNHGRPSGGRDQNKKPTILQPQRGATGYEKIDLMEEEMVNQEKRKLQVRQETIELQHLEERERSLWKSIQGSED